MRRISSHRSDSRREDQRSRGGPSFVPELPWKYESRWSFAHLIWPAKLDTDDHFALQLIIFHHRGILVLNGL